MRYSCNSCMFQSTPTCGAKASNRHPAFPQHGVSIHAHVRGERPRPNTPTPSLVLFQSTPTCGAKVGLLSASVPSR